MPHPIYGPPSHQLDAIELKLYLPDPRNGWVTRLEMKGRSETRRGDLWSMSERWTKDDHRNMLEVVDSVHHALLAAVQDRPASNENLRHALAPGGYEDVPLF